MIDTKGFIKELKYLGVEYDPITKKHWVGSKFISDDNNIITNKHMMTMCSHFFGRKYDLLSYREKKLVREMTF